MSREVLAGITTFFAMAYIIIVNPAILSGAGMAWGAVFLALCYNISYGIAAVTASRYAGMQMPRMRMMPEKSTENMLR